MFVWSAIFCLAAASGAFGFPGGVSHFPEQTSHDPQSAQGVNASKTIDVSGIKTRIRLILEQTLDIGDKKAVSNSTMLNVKVEKRDAKCDASKLQCNCTGDQCDCSESLCSCSGGQCACRTGCQDKKSASEGIGSTTEEPTVQVRIEREADKKIRATTKGTEEDDDDDDGEEEDKPKRKSQESDSDDISGGYEGTSTRKASKKEKAKQNHSWEDDYDEEGEPQNATDSQPRYIPRAMLHRERQLYVRSLSELHDKEGHEDIVKRDTPEFSDWAQEFINEALQSWTDVKPAYKNWDFLYPKMNQVRLARELAKMGKTGAGSAKNYASPPTSLSKSGNDSPQSKKVASAPEDSARNKTESNDDVTMTNLKVNSPTVQKKSADQVDKEQPTKRSVDSGGSVSSSDGVEGTGSGRVKRDSEKASAKEEIEVSTTEKVPEISATEKVPNVSDTSKTSKPEDNVSTGDLEHASSTLKMEMNTDTEKIEGASAEVQKKVRELPSDSNKAEEVTPKEVSAAPVQELSSEKPLQDEKTQKSTKSNPQGAIGQEKQESAPAMPEPKGNEAKIRQKSGLESSWGSDTHDSVQWQQDRRLGDTRSAPDFDNLDIRYLGGNDLNIPPVNIDNFHPEDVTGLETGKPSQPDNQASPVPAKPVRVDLKQGQSASNQNMAYCAILITSLAFLTALKD